MQASLIETILCFLNIIAIKISSGCTGRKAMAATLQVCITAFFRREMRATREFFIICAIQENFDKREIVSKRDNFPCYLT
jgi:hypothetical protein